MIRRLLTRLDVYGTDEPGFREGHPEDRCPVCERPVADHLGGAWIPDRLSPAKWPHRRAAAFALAIQGCQT
jgi:hypothetical protein